MTDQWYFARDGKESGPFSATQMQELAAGGTIRPQDTVWKQGLDKKVPAVKVKGLFAAPPPPAAPPELPEPAAETVPPEPPAADTVPEPALPEPAAEAPAPAEAEPPKKEKFTPPAQLPAKVMRVLSVKGGTLASQDGTMVKFRKKCLKCGYNDTSMTTMRIRNGTTRVNFFCPKCRKSQLTEVVGVG